MPLSSNDTEMEHIAKLWREFLLKQNWVRPLLKYTHTQAQIHNQK